jgi:DNA end-binding protein Ku
MAMQAIWKGAISFGMVTIPIKVFSATEEKDISFRQVHVADGGRIRYKRVCSECGEEVPYSDIGKGYEMADGRMVVLEPEDFADLPLSSKKVIDVLEFVPADQVDPLYLGKSYYLAADGGPGAKPYVLLRDALEGSELYALVKVALRSRESLGLLRTHDNVLVLQVMLWPDEVRDSSFAAPDEDVEIRKQE